METNAKKLIVVLGMHRSGTSALTRGLQVLGVSLGDRLIGEEMYKACLENRPLLGQA